jgi:dipeptidyl aminopeptidase/acylaminoacyl peptidase
VEDAVHSPRLVRFGTFEVDLLTGELRKGGLKLRLTGQPFQVLAILLERPGEVVTREELQTPLWPDTFVDVDHNLNTAINRIREVLGDSADASPRQRPLTRLTFDDGLQTGATWSPDGRFIAYSSNRGGKFDIWLQQVSGGDPVQVTKGRGDNWQPDWSPDGKYIAYRSEDGDGGLFVVPALGGEGLARKIAFFGYYPRWSPDSSRILFRTYFTWMVTDTFYVVDLDGSAPRKVLTDLQGNLDWIAAAWHPDGKRISIWAWERRTIPGFGRCRLQAT